MFLIWKSSIYIDGRSHWKRMDGGSADETWLWSGWPSGAVSSIFRLLWAWLVFLLVLGIYSFLKKAQPEWANK